MPNNPIGPYPDTRFVILTRPRCGSTYLATTLNSHPEILCHGEIFDRLNIFYAAYYRRNGLIDLGTVENRDLNPTPFLNKIWEHNFFHHVVGFKFVDNQNQFILNDLCLDSSVKKIVLRRKNNVKKFVSLKIASVERQWTHYKYQFSKSDMVPVQVEIDFKELEEYISEDNKFYDDIISKMEGANKSYLEVYYEDLLSNRDTFVQLLKYLNVDNVSAILESATLKRNSTDLRDTISNFAELSMQLKNSAFEADLFETNY